MRTPFNIALTQCNPDSGTASVYFEPDGFVDSATGQLRNVNGTATNIEIGLLNSNESKIQLGAESASQNSQSVPITSGSATLTYYAQYVRQGGVPTVGSVRTATQYTIIYQ
jgi:major type 1 subunit fimbrin (pilin)